MKNVIIKNKIIKNYNHNYIVIYYNLKKKEKFVIQIATYIRLYIYKYVLD